MGAAAQQPSQAPRAPSADSSYLAKLPPLLDRELFFADPPRAGAQVSPDGKRISFLQENRGRMNIWIKALDEPFTAARPITADTVRPVRTYFWSRDSKYVLYVQDKGGDENYHLYAVDPTAAPDQLGVPPARDLTPYSAIQAQVIALPREAAGKVLVGLNDRDPAKHDVYRVDLATGARELLRRNDDNVLSWSADQDGKLVLAQRMRDDGSSELLEVDGEYLAPFMRLCAAERGCGVAYLTGDGGTAYVVDTEDDGDRTQLYKVNIHGRIAEMLVARDPRKQADFTDALFSEARDELDAIYFDSDRRRVYPMSGTFEQDNRAVGTRLNRGDVHWGTSSTDERYHVVTVQADVDPGSVYLYDRGRNRLTLLFKSRPNLSTGALAEMEPVRYPARDGKTKIPAYLTVPKGVAPKNLPLVVFPHGGPWARDTWGYNGYAQFLANRGYAVLMPNFRASTGYGRKFLDAGNRQWGEKMQDDVTWGVKYLVSQGIADPKRVAIMGGSYGGYATLAGVAFTPDLYAAAVDIVGPSNLITLLESIPPYWEAARKLFAVRMGDASTPEGRRQLERQSPLNSASKIKTPLLVIQGANDPRVNKRESDQIVVALRDRGFPVDKPVQPSGSLFRSPATRRNISGCGPRHLEVRPRSCSG